MSRGGRLVATCDNMNTMKIKKWVLVTYPGCEYAYDPHAPSVRAKEARALVARGSHRVLRPGVIQPRRLQDFWVVPASAGRPSGRVRTWRSERIRLNRLNRRRVRQALGNDPLTERDLRPVRIDAWQFD